MRSQPVPGPDAVIGHRYGDDPAQVAELWLPRAPARGPVVVLVHGGFWKRGWDRTLEHRVAADLAAGGRPVWNVDYRAVGAGGGWPATFTDVAAAVDALADVAPRHGLATDGVVVMGHSAGGALALWAAARPGLPAGSPGASPRVRPVAAVSQAGVDDLALGARLDLGGGAVAALLGGPPERQPGRYALASPAARVPVGVPVLCVVGEDDDTVPPEVPAAFVTAARAAGDDARLVVVPGEGHDEHLDPGSACWAAVQEFLDRPAVP